MSIQINSDKEYFFATTALEEFWDVDKPILFAGRWCLLHDRQQFWQPLNGVILDDPYIDSTAIYDAIKPIDALYKKLLPSFVKFFNTIHDTNHSQKYWQILIGPWLISYLSVLYHRYMTIRRAIEHYPNLTTIGIAKSQYLTAHDTKQFINNLQSDQYNLQLYTRVFEALGIDVFRKKTQQSIFANQPTPYIGIRSYFVHIANKIIGRLSLNFVDNQSIMLVGSSLSFASTLSLSLKTKGRVVNCGEFHRAFDFCKPGKIDTDIRGGLKNLIAPKSEYENLVLQMLPIDVPIIFIECYKKTFEKINKIFPKPACIVTAVQFKNHDLFKFWAAGCAEQGTTLIVYQHGGDYGIHEQLLEETHEINVADFFFSWGWQDRNNSKVLPLPMNKLIGRKLRREVNAVNGVLFVVTAINRYPNLITTGNFCNKIYQKNQFDFVETLSTTVRKDIRIRLYQSDFGWGYESKLKQRFPNIQLEKGDTPFRKSIQESRLYVCDHMATTYVESLAIRKPTIIFWKHENIKLKKSAEPYFAELRKVGILHETPQSAAILINLIYDDVEKWWNEPHRKAVVERFCNNFARTTPNAINILAETLGKISDQRTINN
jgi:putative transferase (TIGR04331 family)